MTDYFLPLACDFKFKKRLDRIEYESLEDEHDNFQFTATNFEPRRLKEWHEFKPFIDELQDIYSLLLVSKCRVVGGIIGVVGIKHGGIYESYLNIKLSCKSGTVKQTKIQISVVEPRNRNQRQRQQPLPQNRILRDHSEEEEEQDLQDLPDTLPLKHKQAPKILKGKFNKIQDNRKYDPPLEHMIVDDYELLKQGELISNTIVDSYLALLKEKGENKEFKSTARILPSNFYEMIYNKYKTPEQIYKDYFNNSSFQVWDHIFIPIHVPENEGETHHWILVDLQQ